jgi:hypothetical protein
MAAWGAMRRAVVPRRWTPPIVVVRGGAVRGAVVAKRGAPVWGWTVTWRPVPRCAWRRAVTRRPGAVSSAVRPWTPACSSGAF